MEDEMLGGRQSPASAIRGRGTAENPPNRFERLIVVEDPDPGLESQWENEQPPRLETHYYRDPSRSIIAFNDSPDLNFNASLNPYRGCEHGCSYCYARPTHEYLGFSAGLDFESRILVKTEAPALLRKLFAASRWQPQVVAVGAATDPYQPVEGRLQITRRCLQVFAEFRNPLAIVTKSALVTRDVDVLEPLVEIGGAAVNVSITTLDRKLSRIMEPRAAVPNRRLEAVAALARAKIPVGVMIAPIIPGLTDHEVPAIVEAATRAGARWVGHIVLRLPHGVADLFEAWLQRHFPDRARKVMNRVQSLRGGRRNDPRFHSRMRGEGVFADQIRDLVALSVRRSGLREERPALSASAFRRPPDPQLSLFESAD
jgi:DNA repair photolyase